MMRSNVLVLLLALSPMLADANNNTTSNATTTNTTSNATTSNATGNASTSGSASGPNNACNESSFTGPNNHSSYTGCQTKTRSGRTCQKWDAQTPHTHSAPSAAHNYCRNPVSAAEQTLWCYTEDPLRRWGICDPLIPDFLVTQCEKNKCKAQFDAVDKAAVRDQCVNSRDIGTWGKDGLAKCCPTVGPLGTCVAENCDEASLMSSTGTDTDLSFHIRFTGAVCACSAECPDVATLIATILGTAGLDLVKVMTDLQTNGEKSEFAPILMLACSKTGVGCVATSKKCAALGELKSSYTLGNRWQGAYEAKDFPVVMGGLNMALGLCPTESGGDGDGECKDNDVAVADMCLAVGECKKFFEDAGKLELLEGKKGVCAALKEMGQCENEESAPLVKMCKKTCKDPSCGGEGGDGDGKDGDGKDGDGDGKETMTGDGDGKKNKTSDSTPKKIVSMKMTIVGLDYDKVMADDTVKAALETDIKTSVLASLPTGYTKDNIKVTLSKGSVQAKVDITPLADAKPLELSNTVKAAKDTIQAASLKKVEAAVAAKPELLEAGKKISLTVEDPKTEDAPKASGTSTDTSSSSKAFGRNAGIALALVVGAGATMSA